MNRETNHRRVRERREPWDIVVIGGGATGAGCALDATSRGLDVLLLEQHDFGKGTSSRSTKLIHGGVRYLRQGNIALVREALRERAILLENAPHVVHKQEFVIPCYSVWQKIFYGIGMKVYDFLAGEYNIGAPRTLNKTETLERLPDISETGLNGGILYYDAQFDDTRLLIDILRTANEHGATILNYARVTSLEKQNGRLGSVTFVDEESGRESSVNARCVINAAGVFCDAVRAMSDMGSKPVVTFSQGIHLVFDRKFLPTSSAIIIPKTSDGRVIFCIPWHNHLLVGTTDTPIEKPSLEPHALESEIDFVVETVGKVLAGKPQREDILSVWAGIRPLVKNRERTRTASLSRSHDLFVDRSGLITITGGKWTTYRQMAKDAVDKAIEAGALAKSECVTASLKINAPDEIPRSERLHPDLPYTREDVVRAVLYEMSLTLEDVLARRTRALFLNAAAAIEIAPAVAKIMADERGKNDEWAEDQLVAFRETAECFMRR